MVQAQREVERRGEGPRLYVACDLAPGAEAALGPPQTHYLTRVMRLGPGDPVLLFNGRDGEWRARIASAGRGGCRLALVERRRPQEEEPDLWLVFAPIKKTRLDYLVEKATELGVSALWPVETRRTVASRVNLERLRLQTIEAAEQSERLTLPEIKPPVVLERAIAAWPPGRRILLCDESGEGQPIAEALPSAGARGPWAVLCGPEGGFARSELDALRSLPFVTAASLGPRALRADTAALAALSCWQALIGDWRSRRRVARAS